VYPPPAGLPVFAQSWEWVPRAKTCLQCCEVKQYLARAPICVYNSITGRGEKRNYALSENIRCDTGNAQASWSLGQLGNVRTTSLLRRVHCLHICCDCSWFPRMLATAVQTRDKANCACVQDASSYNYPTWISS